MTNMVNEKLNEMEKSLNGNLHSLILENNTITDSILKESVKKYLETNSISLDDLKKKYENKDTPDFDVKDVKHAVKVGDVLFSREYFPSIVRWGRDWW